MHTQKTRTKKGWQHIMLRKKSADTQTTQFNTQKQKTIQRKVMVPAGSPPSPCSILEKNQSQLLSSHHCTLGRFIKSKFWKFDISTHFLCDKYHDKEKVQKKFCSNIAPSIGTGPPLNHPFLHSKTRPKYAKYVK